MITTAIIYYLLVPLLSGFLAITAFPFLGYYYYRNGALAQILLLLIAGLFFSILGAILFPYAKCALDWLKEAGGVFEVFAALLNGVWDVTKIQLTMSGEGEEGFSGALFGLFSSFFLWVMYVSFGGLSKFNAWIATLHSHYRVWSLSLGMIDIYEGRTLEKQLNECHMEGYMAMISLKGGKVYLGYVVTTAGVGINDDGDDTHIKIMPFHSGYRNKKTQKITMTADYTALIEHIMEVEEGLLGSDENETVTVVVGDAELEFTADQFKGIVTGLATIISLSEIETAKAWFPYMSGYLIDLDDSEEIEMKFVKAK